MAIGVAKKYGVVMLLLIIILCGVAVSGATTSTTSTLGEKASADTATQLLDGSVPNGALTVFIFQTLFSLPCATLPTCRPPTGNSPPVRTVIATPSQNGTYPVILFKHGFALANCGYSQLFQYLASSGYIVVAPQTFIQTNNASPEIDETAEVAKWIPQSLAVSLNAALPNVVVVPNVSMLVMAGHSRGGKIAFALALGKATVTDLPSFSALVTLDPVDSTALFTIQPQMVKAGCNHTDNQLSIPALILGTEYGSRGLVPCAPACCSHQGYFNCSSSPLMYHFNALEYGHLDFLDGPGILSLICPSGHTSWAPLRNFAGRLMVAFLQATLAGNEEDMRYILDNWEEVDSVRLEEPQIYTADEDALLKHPFSIPYAII